MPNVRKIKRNPLTKNYFLVDTNFLVNKYINPSYYDRLTNPLERIRNEKCRVEKCLSWWGEIDNQLRNNKARVYISDVCIAEAFKVLAQKYYKEHIFRTPQQYGYSKYRMSKEITTPADTLRAYSRRIKYHDVSTCRDIIISVDRFYEMFMIHQLRVQIADLLVIATAKYLMDFYDIPKNSLHIITLDESLYAGIRYLSDLPKPFNPCIPSCEVNKIFI